MIVDLILISHSDLYSFTDCQSPSAVGTTVTTIETTDEDMRTHAGALLAAV